jgi:hypothetical protein
MHAPDTTAPEHCHEAARSLFSYSQYKPTELIWAQEKGYMADKSATFKSNNTKNRETDHTPILVWDGCVRHAGSLQEEILEPIFINTIESSVPQFSKFCQLPSILKNQKNISVAEPTAILR